MICGALLRLSIALPARTHSALSLRLVPLVFGAAYGGMNMAMNSAAVDPVAELRRPVMPSFHAAFSLGGMVGAGPGGLVAGGPATSTHRFLLTGTLLLERLGRTRTPVLGGATAAAGMLPGPPAIGFLADRFSLPLALPLALTTVALPAAAAAALGYGARNAAPAPPSAHT